MLLPGLERVAGSGDLQGSFEAFKFSETSLVRFQVANVDIYLLRYTRYPPHQVSVQFCAGECRPVSCDDGEVSFGRRRRETRRQFRDRDGVRYDRRLGQEVLDTDTANLGTDRSQHHREQNIWIKRGTFRTILSIFDHVAT